MNFFFQKILRATKILKTIFIILILLKKSFMSLYVLWPINLTSLSEYSELKASDTKNSLVSPIFKEKDSCCYTNCIERSLLRI